MIVQSMIDRLRPLVGSKGWDYCVVWKLSDDQRYIELVDCCCGGTENVGSEIVHVEYNNNNNNYPPIVSPCRDVIVEHPRTKSCDLLLQLPSSMLIIDSGIYAEASLTDQIKWLDYSNNTTDSTTILMDESVTRVLIPVARGLIELLATKQVPEDQNLINFITTQLGNMSIEEESAMINEMQNHGQHKGHENFNFPGEVVPLHCDSMSFLHSFSNYNSSENVNQSSAKEDGHNQILPGHENDHIFSMMENDGGTNNNNNNHMHMQMQMQMQFMEGISKDQNEESMIKQQNSSTRADSISDCSDQIGDEQDDVVKYRRRTGKPQSKNLIAERKRRQKLNDRLYSLRALVPKISKLDRAAILGDAIEFVKDLQRQAKDLQDELEENSDDEDDHVNNNTKMNINMINGIDPNISNAIKFPKSELEKSSNSTDQFHVSNNSKRQSQNMENINGKGQQMEAQVEVSQIDVNEFCVKVFCEHKSGGFFRLMEALTSLGLEVTNVNVTSFRGLVSNVLKVEKKDLSELIQVDHVRDSLLELTKSREWTSTEMPKPSAEEIDYYSHHHNHYDHHHHHCTTHIPGMETVGDQPRI
ncbi:hypothetical protein ACFE04_022285 [Oxalis oulophora]